MVYPWDTKLLISNLDYSLLRASRRLIAIVGYKREGLIFINSVSGELYVSRMMIAWINNPSIVWWLGLYGTVYLVGGC